jgi:hypothetical protein
MRRRGTAAWTLGLWLVGCKQLPQPDQVKKVEECVELYQTNLAPATAKAVARALIEEQALVEEAVASIYQCWSQLPPETLSREILVSEILEWIKEWDNLGRPKYLAQFFHHFIAEPPAREARQMAAAAFTERLESVEKDENAGLRAILLLLTKALGDDQNCVRLDGKEVDSRPMERGHLLGLFAGAGDVNAWQASGLELAFEARRDCPGEVRIEFLPEPVPASEPTPMPGASKLKARVTITRDGVMMFDKEYHVDPQAKVLFSDFLIP